MAAPEQTYLGDGLYVEYDGLMFTLIAPRDGINHVVHLEPEVLDAFLLYVGKQLGGRVTFSKDPK